MQVSELADSKIVRSETSGKAIERMRGGEKVERRKRRGALRLLGTEKTQREGVERRPKTEERDHTLERP